jgi:hypothetical protein
MLYPDHETRRLLIVEHQAELRRQARRLHRDAGQNEPVALEAPRPSGRRERLLGHLRRARHEPARAS